VYFRDPTIAQEFESFSDAVSDFYALAGISHPEYRTQQIQKLKSYFGNAATNWERLADQEERRADFFNWFFTWWDLRQQVLLRKDEVVRKLLAAPIDFLHSTPAKIPGIRYRGTSQGAAQQQVLADASADDAKRRRQRRG
jgi:hypothetical protein